jgi:RimJ/RimL family protein N-acetyltransferase/8-oxo-dGTP pyrophosphatase MutT (NUDIX family)
MISGVCRRSTHCLQDLTQLQQGEDDMRERKAACWLVIDPEGRVLLFRFHHTAGPLLGQDYWATPGGGVEEGESFATAATRELHEETGIHIATVGPVVAERHFVMQMPDGEYVRGLEQYFAVRVSQHEVSREGWTSQEVEVIAEYRWWSADELESTQETVWPENLRELLSKPDSVAQPVLIRIAASTDAPCLASVHLDAWQAAYQGLLSPSYLVGLEDKLEHRANVLREAIVQRTMSLWVIERGDQLLGWASSGPSRDPKAGSATAELRAINLLPEVWSQGLGRRLWQVIEENLARDGYTDVTAWVLAGNERAIGFYQAIGFVHEPGSERTVIEDGESLSLVRYRTQLIPSLVQTPLLTPRLEVVAPDVAQAQPLADALNASYESHRLFLVWSRPRWEVTDTLKTLQRAQSDFVRHDAEKKFFLLTHEHPQQLVGCIGFTPKADGFHEIGYWANQSFQGRGLMREALTVLIAQLPGARLYLTTSSANTASRKVAESVGFRLVRTLVGDRRSDVFGVCDTLVFYWPVVRPATFEDAAQIAGVHIRSWQQAYRGLMNQAYLDGLDQTLLQRQAHWEQSITEHDSQVQVASLADALIGWISFGRSRDHDADPQRVGEVMAVYALAEHWGSGVGRRLWLAALAWLANQGYEKVTLWVLVENVRAIRFYQAAGLAEEPETRRTLERGGMKLQEVRYSGRL